MFTPHCAPTTLQGNILINSDLTACIGDFGLTNITSSASISMALSTPSSGGTCRWMAPELLKSDDMGGVPQKPSKESDIYAFGMVAYEVSVAAASSPMTTRGLIISQIFAHCSPYRHLNSDYMVLLEVISGKRPARPLDREVFGLEDSVWDVVQECWNSDPQTRPGIKGVRTFLEPLYRKWIPPTIEEINGIDLDASTEVDVDSTTAHFTRMCSNVKHCDAC